MFAPAVSRTPPARGWCWSPEATAALSDPVLLGNLVSGTEPGVGSMPAASLSLRGVCRSFTGSKMHSVRRWACLDCAGASSAGGGRQQLRAGSSWPVSPLVLPELP